MNKPEPKFFSAGFSRTGSMAIVAVIAFAFGCFAGREFTLYQIKRGIEGIFGG